MNLIICIIVNNKIIQKKTELYPTYYFNNDNYFEIITFLDDKDFDFVLIAYNNTYIVYDNLVNYLKDKDPTKNLYIGGHGDIRKINNINFHFHSYLPGIILTKSSCSILNNPLLPEKYNNLCNQSIPELANLYGIAIGYYAKIFNFTLIDCQYMYYCNWLGEPCHRNQVKKHDIITCSNMNTNDITNFDTYLNCKIINNNINFIILPGGGLGNILFQYFFGYSINKLYNKDVYYQINYNYWRGDINKYKIFQHLNFIDTNTIDTSDFKDFIEPHFYHYDIYFDPNVNYKISGQFQSFKYFTNYIDGIKQELFSNVYQLYNEMLNKYLSLKNGKNTCMIHVRRGDYLNYSNIHPICSDEYYIEALKIIPNCRYFIFSDDLPFVNNWNVLKNIDFIIIDEPDPEKTLLLMTLCNHFIIANSSLSLAAYFLRDNINATLVAPKLWFGVDGLKYDINDIIPKNEKNHII